MMDSKPQLSFITRLLHWLVALGIIVLLGMGLYMAENDAYSLFPIHKSFGVLILGVVLVRVVWRIQKGWPEAVGTYPKLEQLAAKITHWVLMIGSVLMPISGMLMSVAGGHGLVFFGLTLVAPNINPDNVQDVLPLHEGLAGIGHETHEILGTLLIAVIALHIIAALKHHFMDKDTTLLRMLGR